MTQTANNPRSDSDQRPVLDPALVARLAGLRIRAGAVVDGYLVGQHRSRRSGVSVEFAQHRQYTHGDDPRHVDWRLFARTNKLYVKRFEQETNLICGVMLDASASMAYRGERSAMSKLEYAKTIAAAIAHLVLRQRDSVGLITLVDRDRMVVPPSSHPAHLDEIIGRLEATEATGATKLGSALSRAVGRFSRRGVIFVISDFLGSSERDDVEQTLSGLRRLRIRGHDVTVVQILDRDELEFPFSATTMFRGLEADGRVLAQPETIRQAYLDQLDRFINTLNSGCLANEIRHVLVATDHPLDETLKRCIQHG